MRIVLDLQSCQSGSRFGGIGRYSLELAKAMILSAPEDEFLIVLNDRNPGAVKNIRREFQDILPADSFRVFAVPENCFYLHDEGITSEAAEFIREQFIIDLQPDFVHLTSLFEGFLDKVVTSVRRSAARIPTAVTLYDLIPMVQKELYLKDDRARRHYLSKFDELKKANALLAISEFSAREAREMMGEVKLSITDIRGGIDASFKVIRDARSSIADFLSRQCIGEKFLLYTASFDQRKNQKNLIEAFASLPAKIRKEYQLVIVGDGWSEIYRELRTFATSCGLSRRDLIFTGRIRDEELVGLYNICKLFVFPSLWEGLGLPVLEAMACGAPVVGSNTTSVPEVLGWDAAAFDPTSVTSITAKITQALTDSQFYAALKSHGAKHVQQFTWAESARRALEAIRDSHKRLQGAPESANSNSNALRSSGSPRVKLGKLLQGGRYTDTQIWEFACCLAANELETNSPQAARSPIKLGWVSSWMTRCGIASYSANLVRDLSHDVYILAAEAPDIEPPDSERVSRCWSQGKEQDLERLAKRIEELELTDIVVQFNFGFFNFEAFNKFVESQISQGRRIYITLHSTQDTMNLVGHRLIDLRRALNASTAIIVHADKDVRRLRELGISQNVEQISQGASRLQIRKQKPLGTTVLLASYGFFLPHKGLHELIEALAIMRKAGFDVRLRMVNANYGDSQKVSETEIDLAKAKVESLGLTDRVEFITDYLEDEKSVELLREADLIIYAYQDTGESSSAAVRTGLSSGTPVAVTPLEIFADVAQATYKLPGVSPEDIAQGVVDVLNQLRAGGDDVESRSRQADAWRISHDVTSVGARLMRIIEREAATEVWHTVLEQEIATLPARDAVIEGGMLRSVRLEGGLLAHGPYINLEAGLYRLVAIGNSKAGFNARTGEVAVTSESGAVHIGVFDLGAPEPGVVFDGMVRLDQKANQVEFVFSYAQGAKVELSGYKLLRRIAHA